RMAVHSLVRHRDDCTWRLARGWRGILLRLAAGLSPEPTATATAPALVASPPFTANTGVDTMYVHLYTEAEDGLPAALVGACDGYKAEAEEEDATVETPWRCFGAPLSMYKAGQGTSRQGRGVSWSFLLKNAWAQLLLRRSPLSGLVGSVRLSAECLWTYGPRGALDRMRADLESLWRAAGAPLEIRFQLSQIHLCADVANFRPTPADLGRLLTRSLKKAIYIPSLADELQTELAGKDIDKLEFLLDDLWLLEAMPPEWEGIPLDFYDDAAGGEDQDQADESGDSQSGEPAEMSGMA